MAPEIITCPQWGARPPREDITIVGKAKRIIIHHTAGHHRDLDDRVVETREEAMQYARDIQAFHMGPERGWIDSGHNFLVCRNGMILQGRWITVSAIQAGKMVRSAHCPTQNENIGIEHEHKGDEEMTDDQLRASAELIAWASTKYNRSTPLPLAPHSRFFPTSCPTNLIINIPRLARLAQAIMNQ